MVDGDGGCGAKAQLLFAALEQRQRHLA